VFAKSNKITVQVNFNDEAINIEQTVDFKDNITALEALQYVAKVQTHPVDNYVFVDAINKIYNIKGKNAWYFSVNDKPAKTLAINCNLAKGDVVKWIYKKDVCSKTIETKEPCPDNFGM
jgi:hypothetical protein